MDGSILQRVSDVRPLVLGADEPESDGARGDIGGPQRLGRNSIHLKMSQIFTKLICEKETCTKY